MRPLVAAIALAFCSFELAAAVTGHVIDDDGKPLAGARVRVVAVSTAEANYTRQISSTPEPVALGTTTTDERGAFRIDTKGQPVVTLIVDTPGRAVRATEVVDGEDAGTFLLRAAPTRRGRVTAAGKPVVNATVIVNYTLTTRTDEQGYYSVPDLTGWGYSILVIHPDFAITEITRRRDAPLALDVGLEKGTAVRGKVVDAEGRPVAHATVYGGSWPLTKSGEDGSFTIPHLPATMKSISARGERQFGIAKRDAETIVVRPTATITGTVRNVKDDTPIAGMRVGAPGNVYDSVFPSTFTDARGNFTLEILQLGIVPVSLSHPSFAQSTTQVTVTEGARIERSFVATPYGRVAGFVIDEQKKPVSGALVNIFGSSSYSAPDGAFSVRFTAGERAAMVEATKNAYANAAHGPLRVEPGETRSGIRIVLPKGTKFEIKLVDADGVAITGEPVYITRRVDPDTPMMAVPIQCANTGDVRGCRSDAEGKVSFNAGEGPYEVRAGGVTTVEKRLRGQALTAAESPLVIELERGAVIEGRLVWSDGTAVTVPATVTIAGTFGAPTPVTNGTFTIRNVAKGKVMLAPHLASPTPMQGEPVEVTAPASGVVLKLQRFGRIEGRVVEREGQRPVKQFTVGHELRGGRGRGNTMRSFTADDGRFVLEEVVPGSVDVFVTAPGFVASTTAAVEVGEAKSAAVEVQLERAGTVAGRVTSGGRPIAGAVVTPAARGRGAASKQTDANGEYVLDQLSTGSHDLMVRKEGYVDGSISINVEAGKETRGDVELSRGRELQVRVVDSDGRPIPLAEVMYDKQGRGERPRFPASMMNTDAEGMYKIAGLSDVTYAVRARKSGYAEGSVEVNPAVSPTATITLARGGSISGRVSGLPAAELQMVDVYATSRSSDGASARGTVDASGAFTIRGVPDGEVTVSAQQIVPPRRRVSSAPVKVTGGIGPFVELDFGAGFAVRGRVKSRGRTPEGMVHFMATVQGGRPGNGTQINPDGTYEVRLPSAGEYRVTVSFFGSSVGTIEAGKVDVRGDMTHDIEVRAAAIRGRVLDAATRAPVSDARVSLTSARGGGTTAVADSTGRFIFELVGDGTSTVRAMKEGYASDPREVVLQGSDAEVELLLTRGELVVVTVIDAMTGQNVDAYVGIADSAEGPAGGASRPADRDANGTYRFWLRPGSYSIRVMARDHEPKTVPLVVPGTPAVRIEMKAVKRE